LGYSPDHRTLAVVSIGSNSVTFIDTATNAVHAAALEVRFCTLASRDHACERSDTSA
jgi:hypothetical protein